MKELLPLWQAPSYERGISRQFALYANPSDYPGKFVVRLFLVYAGHVEPTAYGYVSDTRKGAEKAIPKGFVWMERHANDDACILGSWI